MAIRQRDITAFFTGRVQDTDPAPPTDMPTVLVQGQVQLIPVFTGDYVTYETFDPPENVTPGPVYAEIVDGFLMGFTFQGDEKQYQPLRLLVTHDSRGNQLWHWRISFTSVTIGGQPPERPWADRTFPVPDEEGVLDITGYLGAQNLRSAASWQLRGERGLGITDIDSYTDDSGAGLDIAYSDGQVARVPVPTVPGGSDESFAAWAAGPSQTRTVLENGFVGYSMPVDPPVDAVAALRAAIEAGTVQAPPRRAYAFSTAGAVEGGLAGSTPPAKNLFVAPNSGLVVEGRAAVLELATQTLDAPLTMIQLGAGTDPAAGFIIRDLELHGRLMADAGYQVWGIGNRRQAPSAKVHNVLIENVRFFNFRVAVTEARRNHDASLGADRSRGWVLRNVFADGCDNRAVELSQNFAPIIDGYRFRRVETGLHLLGYTEGARVSNVYGRAASDALRINFGVSDFVIDGFDLGFEDTPSSLTPSYGALHYAFEPTPLVTQVTKGRFRNGRLGKSPTLGRSITVYRDTGHTITIADQRFTAVEIDGDIRLVPFNNSSAMEIADWVFERCLIRGDVITTGTPGETNIHGLAFIDCDFTSTNDHYIRTAGARYINCRFAGRVIVSDTAKDVLIQGCTMPQEITDHGTNTTLSHNTVYSPGVPGPGAEPVLALGGTVALFDADSLTGSDGSGVASWAPVAGSAESEPLVPRGATQPTMVAPASHGGKAVRNPGAGHVYTASVWATARQHPRLLVLVFKPDANTGAIQNLLSGLSGTQVNLRLRETGLVTAGGTGSETTASSSTSNPVRFGEWNVAAAVLTTSGAKVWLNGEVPASFSNVATDNPMTGLSLFSSGSGGTPRLVGEISYAAVSALAPTDAQVANIVRSLGARFDVTLV